MMKTTIPAATPMIKWVQKIRRRNVRMAGGLVMNLNLETESQNDPSTLTRNIRPVKSEFQSHLPKPRNFAKILCKLP